MVTWASAANLLMQILGIIFVASPIWLIGGLWLYKKRLGRYPIEAIILERREDNLVAFNDVVGKRIDRHTGLTYSHLKASKDTIPVINYEWLVHRKLKATNLLEKIVNFLRPYEGTIFLYKYGSKQYKPINMKSPNGKIVREFKAIKDKDGNPIFVEIFNQINPHKKLANIDFEVIDWDNINFMIQEQRATDERRRAKKNWLAQYAVPLAMIGASAVILIIAMYFSVQLAKGSVAVTSNSGGQKAQPAKVPIVGDIIPGG